MDKNHLLEKSFGEKLPNIVYRDRVGAYAITFDNVNRVPVVQTSTGFFLLGGGIEQNETQEECIIRECLEEAGLNVKVKAFVCKGDKYHWSDTLRYYMHGIGYFYYVEVIEKVDIKTEDDHRLLWLPIDECCEKLFLEHQAWAVRQAAVIFNKDKGSL